MKFGSRTLSLDSPKIMGILNVTPDSFSDGGRFVSSSSISGERVDIDGCLRVGEKMQAEGADFIDVGGESTRPGAAKITTEQEQDRVLPVLEKLSANLDIILSIDTSDPSVIRESAKLGAGLVNDVRALEREGAMQAAVEVGLPVCLMHMQGSPKTMQNLPQYTSVVDEVSAYFDSRIEACVSAGLSKKNIILDPGIGFGKSVDHNRSLLKATGFFSKKGMPVLVGVSRKSIIGKILNHEDPNKRLAGSLALAYDQFNRGASILRVHDVNETSDMLKLFKFLQ